MLIHFLNDILDHKYIGQISKVQFLSTVQAPEIAAKKQRILDVLCTDQKGVQDIIEMLAKTTGFEKEPSTRQPRPIRGSCYRARNMIS